MCGVCVIPITKSPVPCLLLARFEFLKYQNSPATINKSIESTFRCPNPLKLLLAAFEEMLRAVALLYQRVKLAK